jgi:DNA adenine methylase
MRGDDDVSDYRFSDGRRHPSPNKVVMAMATYPGGKNGAGIYQRIICHMPPHRIYIEPFIGGGAIMRLKKPAVASIGIDADGDVVEMWASQVSQPNLMVMHADALDWLANHAISDDTLIYLDPPYLMETRRQHHRIYRCELCDDQHQRLLGIITHLHCMVMISGYWSEMYANALATWRTDSFPSRTRGGSVATEWLWMNFPEPLTLHDYQYLGSNFRERERIKRKTLRWKHRLSTMPTLERHAIMAAIQQLGVAISA